MKIDMVDDRFILTLAGASDAAGAERDDEPTWQHSTVPTSQHAAKSGSQAPEWMDGIRSASGFSGACSCVSFSACASGPTAAGCSDERRPGPCYALGWGSRETAAGNSGSATGAAAISECAGPEAASSSRSGAPHAAAAGCRYRPATSAKCAIRTIAERSAFGPSSRRVSVPGCSSGARDATSAASSNASGCPRRPASKFCSRLSNSVEANASATDINAGRSDCTETYWAPASFGRPAHCPPDGTAAS